MFKANIGKLGVGLLILLTTSCSSDSLNTGSGREIKFLVGSDLERLCLDAAKRLNQTQPSIKRERYYLTCEAKGSGDVVEEVVRLSKLLKSGNIPAEASDFPSLISSSGGVLICH